MDIRIGSITPALLLGVMWAGIALATVFAIIKTIVRLQISKRVFLDDVLVYVALAILIVMGTMYTLINDMIFEIILVDEGVIQPTNEFFAELPFFLKTQFSIIVLFWTTLWAVKFSFLVYYKKLFTGLPGNMQKCWWTVSTFVLLAYLGCWITQLTSCEPISTYFSGQCNTPRDIFVSNLSLYYATSVDIICDILIMALPLRLLWGLQINSRQKLALGGIFSLGIIIIIFAIVRVIETSATFHHVNPMWLALWSMVEASVAVVVSCLPSFKSFFSNRSSPYHKNNTPSSGSRFSRFSPPRKGIIRLDDITINDADTIDLAEYADTGNGIEVDGGHASQKVATCYTVGAEGRTKEGIGGESREDILPKMPQNSVHVRNDFYMTSEIV